MPLLVFRSLFCLGKRELLSRSSHGCPTMGFVSPQRVSRRPVIHDGQSKSALGPGRNVKNPANYLTRSPVSVNCFCVDLFSLGAACLARIPDEGPDHLVQAPTSWLPDRASPSIWVVVASRLRRAGKPCWTPYSRDCSNRLLCIPAVIQEIIVAPRSLCQDSCVERLIGSIRRECLHYGVLFEEARL